MRIYSILEHINQILEDTKGVSLEELHKSNLLLRATCFSIAQIGEMMNQLEKALAGKYWNQGLMTEVCKAFIKYLFDIGFTKVLIKAVVENIGSNRVIEKCGFKFTHQEHLEHQSSFKPDPATVNCYELVNNHKHDLHNR